MKGSSAPAAHPKKDDPIASAVEAMAVLSQGGFRPRERLGWGRTLVLALLHAGLFFAAFHPLALFPLAWVAFAPFAVIVMKGSPRECFLGAFLATFLGGGAAVHWLTLFGPEPWAGTAAGFGLYGLLMAALGRPASRKLPAVVWLPLAVVAQEWCRGHLFFFAFPWVYLAHSQVALDPLVQAADLGGAAPISLVVASLSGALADRVTGTPWRPTAVRIVAIALLAGGLAGYGHWRKRDLAPLVERDGPRVMAVQGNIPQELKDSSERRPDLLRTHYNLVMDAAKRLRDAKEAPADVVAWPETMVPIEWRFDGQPWPYDPRLQYASLAVAPKIREWFEHMGAFTKARFIVGSIHHEALPDRVLERNAAFFLSEKGEVLGRYDKMFPAPMSEYTPFEESWPAAYRWLKTNFIPPGFSQFTPGRDVPMWEVKGWKLGASVCFDITFPHSTNLAVRNGADAIVNVSNYGWFKDSAELDLARVQTIFRAIETRRGVVAVCNGGISSFVDPLGACEDIQVTDPKTGLVRRKLIEGALTRPLARTHVRTLFVTLGDWAGLGALALSLAVAAWAWIVSPGRIFDPTKGRPKELPPRREA